MYINVRKLLSLLQRSVLKKPYYNGHVCADCRYIYNYVGIVPISTLST